MPRDSEVVMRPRPWWWKDDYFAGCGQRILVVTDSSLSYDPAAAFGLSRFVAELAKLTPKPTITKAHRGTCPTADVQNFRFDTADPEVTTLNYDQIWLFGVDTTPGAPQGGSSFDDEVGTLATFMNGGGGVFATGDHLDMGFGLCGELPRIRKMREWSLTPMEHERIDTVINPGPDLRTQFDDQSDDIPQRIFPQYYARGGSWSPHPVLRSPIGDIDVLPDHPHESECRVGTKLDETYDLHGQEFAEFPVLEGEPLTPEVVAWSVSAGRYLNPPGSVTGKPPTTPKLFGAISVWDGHQVERGRVVCDATWHHFVNMNLDGTGSVAAPGNNRVGLRDPVTLAFTQDFHQIAEYYRNVTDWLIPVDQRWCHWAMEVAVERYRFPLAEEWRPLSPQSPSWNQRVGLGALVADAFDAHRGGGFSSELVEEALTLAGLEGVAALIAPVASGGDTGERTLIDAGDLRRGVLGSVFDALVVDLPDNPADLDRVLGTDHSDDDLAKRVAVATREAVDAARDHYHRGAKRTIKFVKGVARKSAQNELASGPWWEPAPVDLGTLGGRQGSIAERVNDRGQVVGTSYVAQTKDGLTGQRAFLWDSGGMIDLGTLGGKVSEASDLNDRGQVVGRSKIAVGLWHAFLWEDGTMTDLGTLGGKWSRALGINNAGQVVGFSDGAWWGGPLAFLWQDGMMMSLGTLPGMAGESRASAVNNAGQVVGYSTADKDEHAFLWQDGKMTDLGTLGGESSFAFGINDRGQIVGESDTGTGWERHAFLWDDGVMTDLGTLGGSRSIAVGINDRGLIVGASFTDKDPVNNVYQAAWWAEGTTTPVKLGAPRTYSNDINNQGQVVGGFEHGHALLWSL